MSRASAGRLVLALLVAAAIALRLQAEQRFPERHHVTSHGISERRHERRGG